MASKAELSYYRYHVTYFRAFSDGPNNEWVTIRNMVGGDHKREVVLVTSLDKLMEAVTDTANALGYGVSVGIHPDKSVRKFKGFDARTSNLHFNLQPEEK